MISPPANEGVKEGLNEVNRQPSKMDNFNRQLNAGLLAVKRLNNSFNKDHYSVKQWR